MAEIKDKKGKWGYINTSGEVAVKPAYEVTRDFSEGIAMVKKSEFQNISKFDSPSVTFVDVKSIVSEIAAKITPTDYEPCKGLVNAEQFGKKFKLNPEDHAYSNSLTLPSFEAGTSEVEVRAFFSSHVVENNYHTVTVSDGWFEHQEVVDDGLGWTKAPLGNVTLTAKVAESVRGAVFKLLAKALKEKGFAADEETDEYVYLKSTAKKKPLTIHLNNNYNDIGLSIIPETGLE